MEFDLLNKNKAELYNLYEKEKLSKINIKKIKSRINNRHLIIKITLFILFPLRLFDFLYLKYLVNRINLKKTKNKIKNLRGYQIKLIKKYLIEHHKRYNEKIKENYKLLNSSNLKIKVYQTAAIITSSYAKKLKGKIHNNGFLYFKTVSRNFVFTNIQNGLFPSKLAGKIDYLGNAELKTVQTNWRMIGGRIPKQFIANIISDGRFIAELDQSSWEFLGKISMDKLLCDPFRGNEKKRRMFLDNRTELYTIMKEYEKIFT